MPMNRRRFLQNTALATAGLAIHSHAQDEAEPIIDIHQHVNYSGRSNEQLHAHQLALGATLTVLLPAGRPVEKQSTHDGRSNGLAAAIDSNGKTMAFAGEHPERYRSFANEVADLPTTIRTIRKYLEAGALGIGEQKFNVDADSKYIHALADLAREFDVPILMHFQHGMYNHGIERFHTVLEKHPDVNFIGHAQTWWGNIDKNHDQEVMYPLGKVTPGGITDRLLSDYPNMYGDLSAGSGLNSMIRDEEHARGFFERHRDQLLFGSDCNDTIGRGPGCQGAQILKAIRRIATNKAIERKILYSNAAKLLKL